MSEPRSAVSAKEVSSKFGYYTDEAMLHPVGIQRHGVTRVVMLSLKDMSGLCAGSSGSPCAGPRQR